MALGRTQLNPTLLDTLLELNDLVHALSSKEYDEKIKELKDTISELRKAEKESQVARAENEKSMLDLALVTDQNNKAASIAKKDREVLTQVKAENDKLLNKITVEQDKLAADTKDFLLRSDRENTNIEEKNKALLSRTAKIEAAEIKVAAMKEEYETKLAELKKITG